jgi:hypothetical protein
MNVPDETFLLGLRPEYVPIEIKNFLLLGIQLSL